MSLSTFFKSKKSKSEETSGVQSEGDFAKRSTMRKTEGLTPEDVVNKRFGATKFRNGYAQDEVDDFLDEVVIQLQRLQKEEHDLRLARSQGGLPLVPSTVLTPEDVVNKRFGATKFRDGYDQDEVDDFLDEIVVELRRLTNANAETRAIVAKHIEDNI